MIVAEDDATVSSNKKPSAISDGFGERYVSLLERTVASLEAKIAELTKED
jgi:hypothetical protein